MKFRTNTLYKDFETTEKYLAEEGRQRLERAAQEQYGEYWQLTIGEFLGIVANVLPERLGDLSEPTVLQVYWCRGLQAFADTFANTIKRLTPAQSTKEAHAAEACIKLTTAEGMLFFARSYFGLHSFTEAEQVTLAEYVMAKKESYNNVMFNRALTARK